MDQLHEGLGAVRARFGRWLERFYEENTDPVFAPVKGCLTTLALSVLRKMGEQFSEEQIGQFLAAMEDEWRYDPVEQFCRQIQDSPICVSRQGLNPQLSGVCSPRRCRTV